MLVANLEKLVHSLCTAVIALICAEVRVFKALTLSGRSPTWEDVSTNASGRVCDIVSERIIFNTTLVRRHDKASIDTATSDVAGDVQVGALVAWNRGAESVTGFDVDNRVCHS